MSVPTTPGRPRPAASEHRSLAAGAAGALFGGVAVAAIAVVTGWGWSGVAASVALVPASIAAAIDLHARRLPDVLVALSAAIAVFVTVVVRGGAGFVMGLVGAACLAVPLLVVHAAWPAAMGFGDVKLGGALGVSLGVVSPDTVTALLLGLVALSVSSAVGLAVAAVTRRRDVVFGPALVAGTAVALMSADQLGGAPLSWQ